MFQSQHLYSRIDFENCVELRKIFSAGSVDESSFEGAEALIEELRPESPLRFKLSQEMEEIPTVRLDKGSIQAHRAEAGSPPPAAGPPPAGTPPAGMPTPQQPAIATAAGAVPSAASLESAAGPYHVVFIG